MERRKTQSPSKRYLIAYNFFSAALWAGVLARTVLLVPVVGASNLHSSLGTYTKYVQTLAILEILHLLLGLLKSSLVTTIIQVSSRLLLVWGVCDLFSAPQHSVAYATMLLAWSITEVCRYTYYVVNLASPEAAANGGLLNWLRYNTFFVLYPLGAGSEAWCVFRALPEAYMWSVQYYWVLVVILATYAPGLYNQYTHMIRQRRKSMRGKKKA
ncbi:tyrosine phosphatase-like protein [Sphaerosporella brunnea]|uniref:Very-long-chain (3R)-3-hydroxyacyl-CoA dehydratase n=1 Tax=Sphaerosporella brunnea TaxID=1250544 RepID=A0A5J5F0E9_9PEZI|nr:tyrosine phosphatase-like protein [Sphaerosporella brunnea]